METILNKELELIVNKYVKAYKEDLIKDLEVLLDKNKITNNFIFCVRETGTNLYEKNKLFVKESGETEDFLYFKDRFIKAFEINISKRAKKYVYGNIKEISIKKLVEDVKNKSKSFEKVSVKIIKNDNSIVETTFLTKDSSRKSLALNDLNIEDIKKTYLLEYFN